MDVRAVHGADALSIREAKTPDQVECQGELGYTDLSFKMFLGYRKTFASLRWTQTFFDSIENRARRIYELGSSVLINPDGDRGDYLNLAVGENLNGLLDGMSVGVLLQSNQFRGTGRRTMRLIFLVVLRCHSKTMMTRPSRWGWALSVRI